MRVFDGTSTSSSSQIGNFTGSSLPPTLHATNSSGALTFRFYSTSSYASSGWEATLSCTAPTLPTITSFTPTSNLAGTEVIVTGTGFLEVSTVAFNGTSATYEVINATSIKATVPFGGSTGKISVTNSIGTGQSTTDFVYLDGVVIGNTDLTTCNTKYYDPGGNGDYSTNQNFTQTIYPETDGKLIQIEFQSFDLENYDDYLYIYDGTSTNSSFIGSYTGTTLPPTIKASNNAGALTIQFRSDYYTVKSGWEATITCEDPSAPTISSFTPTSGLAGTEVSLFGTDLATASEVTFNGTSATFQVINSNEIRTFAPNNGTSGLITVTNSVGSATSTSSYTYVQGTIMSDSDLTTCSTVYYDPGGAGNYRNGESKTQTIYPESDGGNIKIEFQSFRLESCCDYLRIYDGTSTSAPLIGSYNGSSIPPTAIASNSSGALTLRFTSDGSATYSGWVANITCDFTLPTVSDFTLNGFEDQPLYLNAGFRSNVISAQNIIITELPENGRLVLDYEEVSLSQSISMEELVGFYSFSFNGDAEWSGTTQFKYKANNPNGESENEATVTIEFEAVEDIAVIEIPDRYATKDCSESILLRDFMTTEAGNPVDHNSMYFSYYPFVRSGNVSVEDLSLIKGNSSNDELSIISRSNQEGVYMVHVLVQNNFGYAIDSFSISTHALSIQVDGDDLSVSDEGNSYQWFLDSEEIQEDANSHLYTVKTVGSYHVEFTNSGGCQVITNPVQIDQITGINYNDISKTLQAFPNPTSGNLHLKMENSLFGDFQLRILDVSGKEMLIQSFNKQNISASREIDMSLFSSGLYLLEITNADSRGILRVMKK